MLNNREIASLAWIIIIIIFMYFKTDYDFKKGLKDTLSILKQGLKLLFPAVIYIGIILWVLNFFQIITLIVHIKQIIYWFFTVFISTFFLVNTPKWGSKSDIYKILSRVLGITIILNIIIEFNVLSLVAEFLLMPVFFLVLIFSSKEIVKDKKVQTFFVNISIILGSVVLISSFLRLIFYAEKIPYIEIAQEFLLFLVLTICTIPLFYLYTAYMRYEQNQILKKLKS